ncbi:alpha/beta hydrolase [Aquimarina sp. 2201CG5-10]|uniref:alpha/beta fold hydrolase n=1 Tax=Aquimarina callyspongiae TaxID=3098150 RepID=UPI002AB509AD|nr:alpha/beta hydrolase [Aquimarina sp. 2201CG5-10]MDY8135495.1 alpha/beta hydrolase [Aquimarina sp. 2201CG5-10]
MKIIKKIFKRIFLSIGVLIALVILAGLVFRLFAPEPHKPMGSLINVDDVKFHINTTGKKSNKPTVVVEAGSGLSTEYYHWLSEGLKDSVRVVRYDRAGLGYSEPSNTIRDAETIAKELHNLLKNAGESPPYILTGHSLGGPYLRVFTQLYPDEVAALVLIDATHPEQVEKFNAAPKSSFRYKSVLWGLNLAIISADLGIIGLFENFSGPIFAGEGLPDEINKRTKDLLLDGKCLRTYKSEIESYHSVLQRAKETKKFGSLPVRVFTAVEIDKNLLKEKGITVEDYKKEHSKGQKEYLKLSRNAQQFIINGNHQTIFTKKENADIICKEILQLL